MIKQRWGFAIVLVLTLACSQAYAAHYQYVSLADTNGLSVEQGETWTWTFDLVNDDMYLWELTSPTSTPGGPTPDITTADSIGSYDPLSPLHYAYLRIDPNNILGHPISNFIELTINGIVVSDWSNPIPIYEWGNPVQDAYGITDNNYSFTVELTGLATLNGRSLDITNINVEGCFDKNPVPVPSAIWLFVSGLLGYLGISRRKTQV